MSQAGQPPAPGGAGASRLRTAARVLIVSSVMFSFISYWRTAAVVLCDLASTAYYIGGIVEQSIGPAAPWFILAVMIFSYAVRSVYIESCALFVRGGVYRVVKEAMGGFLAKLSVSALMFDYILTGPISGVSAGQYIVGLGLEFLHRYAGLELTDAQSKLATNWGSVPIAVAITLYFFRKNLLGIHESSEKALKIMLATTVMAVILLAWCGATIVYRISQRNNPDVPPINKPVLEPNFQTKMNYDKEQEEDPLGFLSKTGLARRLRDQELVEVKEATLIVRAKDGAKEELPLAAGADVTLDGKDADLQDLNPGVTVQLATNDQGAVSKLEASTHSSINWLSLIGLIGLFIAFGHSILAMSGEETLAQVYREVESPKLPNFKKAAFIVFVYSLLLTSLISFLAVMLIPDGERMPKYSGNLINGLAMNVIGPPEARLALASFVVVVGFLILAGAVNTAIIGSNGVLNRVAEDGVMPDWFLKPHPRFGTTHRLLYLIVGLQLFTIFISQGNVILLGEAYAFGVVWSFVFKSLAMVVLRYRDHTPREFKVPLNIRVRNIEIPIGLGLIFLILLTAAVTNLLTKEVATVSGLSFTAAFLTVFMVSEHYHERKRKTAKHAHLEQFNQQVVQEASVESLGLTTKPYRKLVAVRSPRNLYTLQQALAEVDPETTSTVVMTAKVSPRGSEGLAPGPEFDQYDQQLMTAVVQYAERAGKEVKPLIVPTNNPLFALMKTAKELQAHELILGASNKYTADDQMDQLALYWIDLHSGQPAPLTVRILSRDRDIHLDLAGGNRIPKISERKARSVAELRAAGVGVARVMLIHDGTPECSDLFTILLTALDPDVGLAIVPMVPPGVEPINGHSLVKHDQERAERLERELHLLEVKENEGPEIVRLAQEHSYGLIVLPLPQESPTKAIAALDPRARYVLEHAHCQVFLAVPQLIPQEVMDTSE